MAPHGSFSFCIVFKSDTWLQFSSICQDCQHNSKPGDSAVAGTFDDNRFAPLTQTEIFDGVVGKYQISTCSVFVDTTESSLYTAPLMSYWFFSTEPQFSYLSRPRSCYVWVNKHILDFSWSLGICGYTGTGRPVMSESFLEHKPCGMLIPMFMFC